MEAHGACVCTTGTRRILVLQREYNQTQRYRNAAIDDDNIDETVIGLENQYSVHGLPAVPRSAFACVLLAAQNGSLSVVSLDLCRRVVVDLSKAERPTSSFQQLKPLYKRAFGQWLVRQVFFYCSGNGSVKPLLRPVAFCSSFTFLLSFIAY